MEEKRSFERIPSDLQARLFIGNIFYSAKVTNVSENGMFVRTKMTSPVDSVFVIIVRLNGITSNILVKVVRTVREDADFMNRPDYGMGVRLLDAPRDYLEFIAKCSPHHRLSSDQY